MTRNLYERAQAAFAKRLGLSDSEVEGGRKDWKEAIQNYIKYFDSIKHLLPINIQKISDISFHDAIVKKVEWSSSKDDLILSLDGEHCPWGLRGQLEIFFKDVKHTLIQKDFVGDYWLREEIHLVNNNQFSLQALLDRSEFEVTAHDIQLFIDGKKWI